MSGLSFEIKVVVKPYDTDLSICANCQKEILTSMYKLLLVSGDIEEDLEKRYCEPCKIELGLPDG